MPHFGRQEAEGLKQSNPDKKDTSDHDHIIALLIIVVPGPRKRLACTCEAMTVGKDLVLYYCWDSSKEISDVGGESSLSIGVSGAVSAAVGASIMRLVYLNV